MEGRTCSVWDENPKTGAVNFILKDISWRNENGPTTSDVRVNGGIISEIGSGLIARNKEISLDFKNHFLYPGLINSHDHLEMNLYPRIGRPPYHNYTEWAADIYKPKESPVKEIEHVDIKDRLLWGGIKNLISGATTVVHHNPWHRIMSKKTFPVRVIETAWAHSLAFEKSVLKKLPKKNSPLVIHAAEGTDELARGEIYKLGDLGLLKGNTVLIHGVGLDQVNARLIVRAGSSIVWCPSSNLFMFGKTLPLEKINHKVKVSLGSDSTMTGPATLIDEMQVAGNSGLASSEEIYQMVTSVPASIFQLEIPEIKVGKPADFWITRSNDLGYFENILKIVPSAVSGVFVHGELRYGDVDLASGIDEKGFQVQVGNQEKWIAYDVRALKKRIDSRAKGVCIENPLWKMLS